jgi:hypothetical protein
MAAFFTTSSPGPAVGNGASPTSSGVLALMSQAAWFVGAAIVFASSSLASLLVRWARERRKDFKQGIPV